MEWNDKSDTRGEHHQPDIEIINLFDGHAVKIAERRTLDTLKNHCPMAKTQNLEKYLL